MGPGRPATAGPLSAMPEAENADFDGKNRRGFTLVETLIAVLLISVVVTSVFSLALTSRVSSTKTQRRAVGLLYTRRAMEKVKAYVTADASAGMAATVGAPANWKIAEDLCNTGEANCASATCWALEACKHDVSPMLPAGLSDPPISMKLTYTVTNAAGGAKKVNFQLTWDE